MNLFQFVRAVMRKLKPKPESSEEILVLPPTNIPTRPIGIEIPNNPSSHIGG